MQFALWLARRLAVTVGQLVFLSFVAFGVIYITPGSIDQVLLGPNAATPATIAAIRERYNLDDSFIEQYMHWLQSAVHFSFGSSILSGQTVASLLAETVPTTIYLAMLAAALVVLLGIPLGLIAGVRNGKGSDHAISAAVTVCASAPVFATGIILLYIFAVELSIFPTNGTGSGFIDGLWHLILPAIVLALPVVALVARQTRAASMKVATSDYVLFARARGVKRRTIWLRYLLRNSALPVATSLGIVLIYVLTGSVLVERIFSLNGFGSLILTSVSSKDIPVVQAVVLLSGLFVLLANLAADISYMVLDPRVRKAQLK